MSSSQSSFSTWRFVESSGQSQENKKRIAAQACESCRRRKKRCFHAPENQTNAQENAGLDERSHVKEPQTLDRSQQFTDLYRRSHGLDNPAPEHQVAQQTTLPNITPLSTTQSAEASHPRFIGDLNPAVELLSATTPTRQPKNNVGVWHTEASEQHHAEGSPGISSPISLFCGYPKSMQEQLQAITKTQSLDVIPSWQNFEVLEAFYFENIHPILPCVDKALYWNSPVNSAMKVLQQQIICLITCPNPSLKALLRLPGDEMPVPPAEFARRIVSAMRLSIEVALVSDKTVIVQALTAMSLISYGRESLELTPQFFIRAVQHGYTIGLHQPGDDRRNEKTAELFCSVWSMDRLHAAMQGHPVIMHEVDMAKMPQIESAGRDPGFRVLVSIAVLLDKVIALYRPGAALVEIPDEVFPSFEELLEECGAIDLPSHLIATLELFYHAVAILSCRYSSGPQRESHKARNSRQAASAIQILSIMENEDMANRIVALPWVPYAISLSLSTAYHEWRHSKASTSRARAKRRLMQAYKQLLSFGYVFWSAAFMAEMADKVLSETDSIKGEENSNAENTNSRTSTAQDGVEVIPDRPPINNPVGPLDASQSLFADWNLDDLDGILEGNLDPSIPWYQLDLQGLFNVDLQ